MSTKHAEAEAAVTDMRSVLREAVAHLEHLLPGQAPLRDFVHHNTLHGFQHLPFTEALAAARRQIGARGYLPLDDYRALYRKGRITRTDLEAALAAQPALAADAPVCAEAELRVSQGEVYLAALRYPLEPLSASQLQWQVEELAALQRLQTDVEEHARRRLLQGAAAHGEHDEAAAVGALWGACVEMLQLSDAPLHPEEMMLAQPQAPHEEGDAVRQQMRRQSGQQAAQLLTSLLERLGDEWTLRSLLQALTGEDLMDDLRPYFVRHLSSFLDQGFAPWHNPRRTSGFYAAWRAAAASDRGWLLDDMAEGQQQLARLPDDPLDAVIQELRLLGLAPQQWSAYVTTLALELPGWSGMFLWRHHHPDYAGISMPVDMMDYLAVRLVLERLYAQRLCRRLWNIEPALPALRWYFRRHPAELMVRHALFNEPLPEYLVNIAQRLIRKAATRGAIADDAEWRPVLRLLWQWRPHAERAADPTLHGTAWPLFRLAQHLGLGGADLRRLGAAGVERLLACRARLDADTAGYLWLLGYERHYREQIFTALAANHGRGLRPAAPPFTPQAQLVFCMDDREEGMRRHLEEINPALETFGAAGFFNVPMYWRGLDDHEVTALTPVVITPAHEVREVPQAGARARYQKHQRRLARRSVWKQMLFQESRRGLLAPLALTLAAAAPALATLAAKVLTPFALARGSQALRARFDRHVPTRTEHTAPADSAPASPEQVRLGYTDLEQADRVQGLLRNMGLLSNFAPLVVMLGHGSFSQNNPHLAAYDCGACSGRHGGPNARVYCAMANRPEVRAILAERGVVIPAGTWFIGAEHNTGDDVVTWYDLDTVPAALHEALTRLQAEVRQAGALHAQERCRRFASAPAAPAPARAWRHVMRRALDFSQARPELGHATNATAFIGRRAMSRGAFFDRRAFLISYDPAQDPDGSVLEPLLLANGPVGAGINLEYYFSTVDNARYGSGTKVMHNLTGLLGVMEGASSDLRTGLPWQMIEIHEPMRLLVVVEHHLDVLTRIYQRQPPLQELIGNGWILLAAKSPDEAVLHLFDPEQGWQRWDGSAVPGSELPEVERSADWFRGHRDALTPALLRRPVTPEGAA